MFSTKLKPLSKCIFTNILPGIKYKEYTSGILLSVDGIDCNLHASCSILLTGNNKKQLLKPTVISVRTPPIICKDLVSTNIYDGCTGFLITDTCLMSYLNMSNIEFLNVVFARILIINKISNKYFKSNVLINTNEEIGTFYIKYIETNKINNKILNNLVNSVNKRTSIIYNLLVLESFIKNKISTPPLDILIFLKENLKMATVYKLTNVVEKLKTILNDKEPKKILDTIPENEDVLHRYKNSGYWF